MVAPTSDAGVELSVVVPVYNEAGNIPEFVRRLVPLLEPAVDGYEIIFALDPSTDGSDEIVRDLRRQNPAIKLLVFSRRFGQPMATMAGLEHASGDAVVVMDVDLQDPPELVVDMLARWREGYDVVYAQRRRREGETLVKRVVAGVGYKLINRFGEVDIPPNTGDFRLMDRRVVDEVVRLRETHGFLRGLVAIVGFRQTSVQFDRPPRHAGKGNYNAFVGSLRIGLNGLICFSTALLNLSTIIGFVAAFAAFVTGIVYTSLKLSGVDFPLGNPTIVVIVLFMAGIQLICLGIIGQYIGRIYEEVKARPRYIVDVAEGFSDDAVVEPTDRRRGRGRERVITLRPGEAESAHVG
jgi:dolichol-phosphate mannosyltransferase